VETLEEDGNIHSIYDAAEIPLPFRSFNSRENWRLNKAKIVEGLQRLKEIKDRVGVVTEDDVRDYLNPPFEGHPMEEDGER
jgi:hypothetical protein